MRSLFVALLVLALISACKTKTIVERPIDEYYFDGRTKFFKAIDLTAAIEKAEVLGKPLMVEFEADWCLPCKIMSEEVFTDSQVSTILNRDFLNYKLDVEKGSGPNMKFLYGVDILPTFIVMDSHGIEVLRNNGSLIQTEMISYLNEALVLWKRP